jgi:hypothetical protein
MLAIRSSHNILHCSYSHQARRCMDLRHSGRSRRDSRVGSHGLRNLARNRSHNHTDSPTVVFRYFAVAGFDPVVACCST